MQDDALLREFLLDAGLLSRSQLEALGGEDKPLSRALVESGVLGEDEVRRATAHAFGIPFVVLGHDDIALDALILVPEPLSRAHSLVAFAANDEVIEVALLNMEDLAALEPLAAQLGRRVVPRLTDRTSMKRALLRYQKHLKEKFGEMLTSGMHAADALIKHALYSRAGGVHLDPSQMGMLVRYQIGHALHEAMRLPEQAGALLVEQLKSFAKLLPVRRPQEGRFKVRLPHGEHEDEEVTVHVSTLPTAAGEKVSIRLSPGRAGSKGYTLESLGFHGGGLDEVRRALRRPGLVLVAGPDGAGKTTTLYTMLDLLNTPHTSIATVERSVSHRLPHVSQVEAGGNTGLSPGAALRAVLRHDPQVVMVDDVADKEVAALVASAASRGVLVLCGIEAAGAAEALEVLIEAGAPARAVASSFACAVGVAKVERLCTKQFHDKRALSRAQAEVLEPYTDFSRVFNALKEEDKIDTTQWKEVHFARPTSCTECSTGYQGHIGLQEVLPATTGIKELLQSGASAEELAALAHEEGMLTLAEDGLFKAAQGLTSIEEVVRISGTRA